MKTKITKVMEKMIDRSSINGKSNLPLTLIRNSGLKDQVLLKANESANIALPLSYKEAEEFIKAYQEIIQHAPDYFISETDDSI